MKTKHGRRIILQGGYVFEVEHAHAEHIDVLQHRADSYPRLVAALRDMVAFAPLRPTSEAARALLAELGETP